MSKDTIHHLAIQVQSIAESVAWYTTHYACEVSYQDQTWAMLEFENTALALVLADEHPYHFAITTASASDYGTPVLHRDGTSSVYIKDNNNNSIEMLQLPKHEKA